MTIKTERLTIPAREGKPANGAYLSVMTCDRCQAEIARSQVELSGHFIEHEAAANGSTRFEVEDIALNSGASLGKSGLDLCAKCVAETA